MERPAGLGRSLRDVIESLTPVEPDTAARVEFDAAELVERLDELLADVRDLRARVHRLAELVGGDGELVVVDTARRPKAKKPKPPKKRKKGRRTTPAA
jgi:hypothetical protein